MQFVRHSVIALFLAALAVSMLAYAAQMVWGAVQARMADERPAPPPRERVFAVNLRLAKAETIVPVLPAFGEVQSRRTLELRTAMGGRVEWLDPAFVEGGAVAAGQELLRLDDADARATLERADADLRDAEAEERDAARMLDLARDELKAAQDQADLRVRAERRQRDLRERGVGTAALVEAAEMATSTAQQSVLSRRQAVATAEARVDQSATRLARMRLNRDDAARDLADAVVLADFDGTLSQVGLVEGRLVSPNEQVAVLVDPEALEVAFRVSTAQFSRLLDDTGALIPAAVRVSLGAGGTGLVAQGRLDRASAAVGEGLSGRLLFARLETARGFRPGDFVEVAVEEPAVERVVRLPATAYGSDGAVLALAGEDRLEALEVRLVRRQGDDVLLRGPALEGREIVVGRTPLLGAGIKVRPVRQADRAPAPPAMVELSDERRARLVTFVESSQRMPKAMKTRVLDALANPQVPQSLIERIESRMGG